MRPSKKAIYSGLAAAGLVAGAAGISAAASNNAAPADTPADEANEGPENEADEGPETPPSYTSSVQTTPEDESNETDAGETAEQAALEALATVTPDEASAAALVAQPGTVEEVELDNEAGNVVYEVEIIDANGAEFEIIVDAGNASVLATEANEPADATAPTTAGG